MRQIFSALIVAALFIHTPSQLVAEVPSDKGSSGADITPSSLAVVPFYSPEKIWTLYSPFIDYLKASTGRPWELKFFPSHDAYLDGLCSGQSTVGLTGPVPLARAMKKCNARPVVVALARSGKPFYHSVFVTNDPSVKTLKDLRGKKIGFFKGSTGAHILPAKLLMDAGLGMDSIQPVFLENQDRMMTELLAGKLSAAGFKDTLYQRFSKESLRVLATSAPLPNFAFCVNSSVPEQTVNSLVSTLLKLNPRSNPADAELMNPWDDEIKNGFVLPDREYQESVMKLLLITEEVLHESR